MKFSIFKRILLIVVVIIALQFVFQTCINTKKVTEEGVTEIFTYPDSMGFDVVLNFKKGNSFNHPLMAWWVEDLEGNYIQTLYVARSIGKGIFNYGDKSGGKWKPGEIRRPAALPYWSHKRGVKEEDGLYIPTSKTQMPDAVTSATPKTNFVIKSKVNLSETTRFRLLFEINQTWDWNEYWTNNKFPDDEEYKTSCQPSVIYEVVIDLDYPDQEFILTPIGHGHYSGKSGELFKDLSTLTTALNIVEKIHVNILLVEKIR